MTKLLFMRHGESAYNVLGLCNDDPAVQVPLTPRGRQQADAAAERLREAPIELVLVSQLLRAQQTAERVNLQQRAPVRIDARLNDRRTGFEGRPVADYLAAREAFPLEFCGEGKGETFAELKARVLAFLDEIQHLPAQCLLVVTHHEVLQVVHAYFTGLGDAASWNFWVDHASILEYESPSREPQP